MMEHPFVCNVWSHANDPFSEPFKVVFIENIQKSVMDMLKTSSAATKSREQHLDRCVAAQGNYFEGDNFDV